MKVTTITLKNQKITDFAAARNRALRQAKTDWVLFVDSDEKVSPSLAQEMEKLEPGDFAGFYLKRKNYFLGRHVGTDKILRLARKDAGRWQRRVHETWQVQGKIGTLKNPLIHQTAVSVAEMLTKINFYSTLHAQANREEGKKSSLIKIIYWPKFKFIQSLFLGRGILFGFLQAFHSFLAWSKQWLAQNKK